MRNLSDPPSEKLLAELPLRTRPRSGPRAPGSGLGAETTLSGNYPRRGPGARARRAPRSGHEKLPSERARGARGTRKLPSERARRRGPGARARRAEKLPSERARGGEGPGAENYPRRGPGPGGGEGSGAENYPRRGPGGPGNYPRRGPGGDYPRRGPDPAATTLGEGPGRGPGGDYPRRGPDPGAGPAATTLGEGPGATTLGEGPTRETRGPGGGKLPSERARTGRRRCALCGDDNTSSFNPFGVQGTCCLISRSMIPPN